MSKKIMIGIRYGYAIHSEERGSYMDKYVKPMVVENEELAEGVYAASGSVESGAPGCDSKYMNGVWQNQNHAGWVDGDPSTQTKKFILGCNGCPASRWNGCGLLVDQAYLDGATSYNVDNGNRMPEWERQGYKDTDPMY